MANSVTARKEGVDEMDRENRNGERMAKESSGAPLLAGLMIGGLVGAGTMLLLAPQAGRRTRQEIQAGAIDMKDRATDTVQGAVSDARSRARQIASNVRETANDLQNQGKDIAINQLDRVASAAQSGKKALRASKS
jgi:gas vesicle protein